MVQAALVAARLALPAWQRHRPCDAFERDVLGGSLVATALDAVAHWLASGTKPETDVANLLTELRELVHRAAFYVDEAFWLRRYRSASRKALSAAVAALAAFEAFAWTEALCVAELPDPSDAAELEARRAAGPAQHVVQAFSRACLATGIDADQLRKELRISFLESRD